tara:strand:+ start:11824 stop:12972 length:1149 start_codon:yes stop_codon:yes gene_type:complete
MAREIIGYRTNRRGRRVAIYGDSNPSVNTNVTPKPVETLTEGGDQPVLKNKNTNTNNRTQNKPKRASVGGILRYPYEALTAHTDYLQIDIVEYKSVKQSSGSLVSNPASGARRIQGSKVVGSTRPRGLATKALKNTGTILLPVPNSVQDGNSVDYGSSKLGSLQATAATGIRNLMDADFTKGADAYSEQVKQSVAKAKNEFVAGVGGADKAADILKKQLTTQAVGMLGGNITIDQLMARENGEIFNPNMELLFNGPTLRNFKFSYKMMPRNEKEAEQVRLIIRSLKSNMAVKTKASSGQGGSFFLKTPNVFNLRYRTGNSDHPFLHKFKQCFLTDISVNYTGEASHMTYADGTPVSMVMDLTFKELEPIYDVDYDEDGGVGF